MITSTNLDAAQTFLWLYCRLLERHRFAHLFKQGKAVPARTALRAYQDTDGGFGHALEPDGRGAGSQPVHTYFAVRVLDELGACDEAAAKPIIDFLASVTAANGGVPVALPSVRNAPKAPWWNVGEDDPPGSLLPTAGIAGVLHKNGIAHPWLSAATDFCWQAIAAVADTHPYEVMSCLGFLDHVPERERAEREAERLGELVREQRIVLLDPDAPDEARISPGYAPGEYHTPLDYATRPTSLARRWFSDAEIEHALDALEQGQGEDGGWPINWRQWNPVATFESRGYVTIAALLTLRAYGRFA
ncbi:MAG: hypothetical protein ACRDJW_19190 [Thermomicrobiales bacterium]